MFPPCYYFSLKCCSAATVLSSALQGQKVWSTPRAPDRKQVHALNVLLLFVSADVRTRHPRHLCRALERWRLTDELRESSYVAQPSVSETRLCQNLPVCSSGKTCRRRLAWCCKQECGDPEVSATWDHAMSMHSLPLLAQTVFADLYTPNIYFVWWSVGLKVEFRLFDFICQGWLNCQETLYPFMKLFHPVLHSLCPNLQKLPKLTSHLKKKKVLSLCMQFQDGERKTARQYPAASRAEPQRIWKLGSQRWSCKKKKKIPWQKIIFEEILT